MALAACLAPRADLGSGEPVVEASRSERPGWLGGDARSSCPPTFVCAVGRRERAASVEYARTDAYNDAIQAFGRGLADRASRRLSAQRAAHRLPPAGSDPKLDAALEAFVRSAAAVEVTGAQVRDFYWRRVAARGAGGRDAFDYSLLLAVREPDWQRAVADLVRRGGAPDPAVEAELATLVAEGSDR